MASDETVPDGSGQFIGIYSVPPREPVRVRDPARRMRLLLWLSYGAFAAAAIGIGTATYLEPNSHFLSVFGPNLAPDAFGVVLALLLVQRIVKVQRAQELEPLRKRARGAMVQPAAEIAFMLSWMYKVVADEPPPERIPRTILDILDRWPEAARQLNVWSPSPFSTPEGPIPWGGYLRGASNNAVARIEPILDRYAEALGIDAVIAIEDFFNDHLFKSLFREYPIPQHPPSGPNAPFAAVGVEQHIPPFVEHAKAFFAAIGDEPFPVAIPFAPLVAPGWGGGRMPAEG